MVERIADDGILGSEQRLEHSAVGIEARGIENGVVGVEIVADGALELFVNVLSAADEAHRRHSVAAFVHHLLGGLYEPWMVG